MHLDRKKVSEQKIILHMLDNESNCHKVMIQI